MKRIPSLLCLLSVSLSAQIPIRVGISVKEREHLFRLEGGGEVLDRTTGQVLYSLKDGERFRFWYDHQGQANATDVYRVQVGPPIALSDAQHLERELKKNGMSVDFDRVSDGDTYRVLTGTFKGAGEADGVIAKLTKLGFEELWLTLEKNPQPPSPQSTLYGVTERFERIPLPKEGVRLRPRQELIELVGKGRYRGDMDVFPNGQGALTVVNTVELETYLRGVVPKEMGAWQFPALEALKAQTIAARTYAYANRGKRSKEGFDLLDTVADQVYGGRDGEQSLTDTAVSETRGLVATYGGQPIQALFQANSGAATVDNRYVFGGNAAYLRQASNYIEQPTFLSFKGVSAPIAPIAGLDLDLMRLAAFEMVSTDALLEPRLKTPAQIEHLKPVLTSMSKRLNLLTLNALPSRPIKNPSGPHLLLWMARSLGFEKAIAGHSRIQDGHYFLQTTELGSQDLPLAAFLTRRGLVDPTVWRQKSLTQLEALRFASRLWQELEPLNLQEGTLLKDGQIRVQGEGPKPLKLAPACFVMEESPNGALHWVSVSRIQVGDRIRILDQEKGSRLLIRRLDPDGTSMNRYNPTAHWRKEIKEADLLSRMKERVRTESIQSLETDANGEGRVLELRVKDGSGQSHRFTGMRIRSLLGLKDNVFGLIQTGHSPNRVWIAYGRGWGHGVGMDQTGAYGYALEGWTFDRILKHYYQGIEIESLK